MGPQVTHISGYPVICPQGFGGFTETPLYLNTLTQWFPNFLGSWHP